MICSYLMLFRRVYKCVALYRRCQRLKNRRLRTDFSPTFRSRSFCEKVARENRHYLKTLPIAHFRVIYTNLPRLLLRVLYLYLNATNPKNAFRVITSS